MSIVERCLAQKIGNCNGCHIYEMAINHSRRNPENTDEIRTRLSRELCPPDVTAITPDGIKMDPIRPAQKSIW